MTLDYTCNLHLYTAIHLIFYKLRQQRRRQRNISQYQKTQKNHDLLRGLMGRNTWDERGKTRMWYGLNEWIAGGIRGEFMGYSVLSYDDEQSLDVMKLLSSSLLSFFMMLDLSTCYLFVRTWRVSISNS